MIKAYVSLGSNQGSRLDYLNYALGSLESNRKIRVIRKSSIYDSPPCLNFDQPNFLNAVLSIETSYSLGELGRLVLMIESMAGRNRSLRYGPRTLDIDILLYGKMPLSQGLFSVPHSRISERAFVLIPLLEIAKDVSIPGYGSASSLSKSISCYRLVKTDLTWTC
ncbi:2-amino-4-hydroxy-6-hydroxymethyldihydropteridine diphosphokinase [Candidatus Ichthyocystis hellenicum]|uniref:2-amino-4-hydroxy-6- hydroxymethyldihydropteridine diphosphokinase n=1 Tax=Candidatus Ichthyocystis hellenicum TaxID=1561003 RepID=UPI000AB349A5|nr:2-amino-4-hydroxy-6-hydroxymethyldihydropteridine diphosphokinase [Candidatus Ichthyocystis hellenicum]